MSHSVSGHRAICTDDIVESIISWLVGKPRDLAAVCLVQRSWNPHATSALYAHVSVTLPDERFSRTMHRAPALRRLIRDLRITVWSIEPRFAYLLEDSLTWMAGAAFRSVAVACDGGIACDIVARHIRGWVMPSLRALAVEGSDFCFNIPPSVRSLTLVGSTMFSVYNIPDGLEHFRWLCAHRMPHDVMATFAMLSHLEVEFDDGVESYLYNPRNSAPGWEWPPMPSLTTLSIVADEPLFLQLNTESLRRVRHLRISATCLWTNVVPSSVRTLDILEPGSLSANLVDNISPQRPTRQPVECRGEYQVRVYVDAESDAIAALVARGIMLHQDRAHRNIGRGMDLPKWNNRHPAWEHVQLSASPGELVVRLLWLGYILSRDPVDTVERRFDAQNVFTLKKYLLDDTTLAIFNSAERYLFPADPEDSELHPGLVNAIAEWELELAMEGVVVA
ncbi:hypothetical protein AURDEDRAFT_175489 [Auricularia subglabra TFB-10046 SS5]|uniref:Uncharacterized protein n=1 Tax=Auricularia subglabra (strain TFB-10046 / SS5) TaxID=717982 RepID=J0WT99_AURST|nr:hypothetical protein AURDEDRAFT_175489 [Auricularia subglabra TFB-10046 SS5]